MKRLILTLAFLMALPSFAVVLVQNSIPRAEIVVSQSAPPAEKYAANELQYWLCTISGGMIPIVNEATAEKNAKLFVGRDFAKDYPDVLKQLEGTDGYAVRNKRNRSIYIFGAVPKGTLNGVYEFVEQNTDLIWARPEWDLGTIFTPLRTLDAKKLNLFGKPRSEFRMWTGFVSSPIFDVPWQARNKMNVFGRMGGLSEKLGCMNPSAGGGHSAMMFIPPKKYFQEHPEYYALRDGKRTTVDAQPCFLAYEMLPEYMKNLRADIASLPKGVKAINISIMDTANCCECNRCQEPLKLDDGQVISNDHSAFRSAQFFAFLNKVAAELAKTHPDMEIITYGYYFSEVPPPIKLAPNICVYYCPYGRDYKYPFNDAKRNPAWMKQLTDWGKLIDKVQLREYYGDAAMFPRPLEDVVQKDLQFCLENNIRRFCSELAPDVPARESLTRATWDVSAMTCWVISRLWWDPYQDVEELRNYYLKRTYREAAPAMKKYYDIIRKNWYSDASATIYFGNTAYDAKQYILDKGSEEACRSALAEAEALVQHPKSRELVRRQRARFEGWMKEAKTLRNPEMRVPAVAANTDVGTNFDSPLWTKAPETIPFEFYKSSQVPKMATSAKILHDRKNLYIRFHAQANDMDTLTGNPAPRDGREIMPRGDHFEIFLVAAKDGVYRQFGFDYGNQAIFDGKLFDINWTAPWSRVTRKVEGGWEAIVTFPFASFDFNYQKGEEVDCLLYRSKYFYDGSTDPKTGAKRRVREQTTWGQGRVHLVPSFGRLFFE